MKRTTAAAGKSDEIRFFLPFQKLDEEQRQVWGRATEELIDLDDEVITYACADGAFDEWNDYFKKATGGKSQGNVREMHEPRVAGHVIATIKNPGEKAIDLGISITDDDAWKKCKAGDYIGLSIGGKPKKSHVERRGNKRVNVIDELKLIEVSLVDHPANPAALFSVVKRAEPIEDDGSPQAIAAEIARAFGEAFQRGAKGLISKPAGASLGKVLKAALAKDLGGPRSEIASILPAVEALRSVCLAIDSEFFEMSFGPGSGTDERADIATLTAAAEAMLDFILGEFAEQIRSLTGPEGDIMSTASAALQKFLALTKTLTPAQLKKVMSDEDMSASVKAMHAMGHAMVKATFAMGGQDCKVADPHGVEGDDAAAAPADDQPGTPAADAGDKKPAPDPEKKPDPTAAADDGKKPEDTKGATPEHREDLNAVKPAPKDPGGDSGVTMPHAPSDVERPSENQQQRVPDKKSAAETEEIRKTLQEIADEVKGIPALLKSFDGRVKRIEKSPAPIGRQAAPVEKALPGASTTPTGADPDVVQKAVVDELRKAAEAETDPTVRQALCLHASALAVKKVNAAGPGR